MASERVPSLLRGRDGSYALQEVIGRGAYGTVYKGIWREVGRPVAIKRVSRSRLSSDENKALQTEILLFKNLKHKHIVNYIEAVDDPESAFLDIVMEFVEGGSLFSVTQSIRKSLDVDEFIFQEHVVAAFVRQVILGLCYLHKQGVVHRDIKCANILVTKDSLVKLADFGVASTKPADMSGPIDVAGSPYWMAPEIITLSGSSTASDIWSLGCTVIELLTGAPPYHEYADVTALFRIVSDECPPLPSNLSSECQDFLHKCFNKDAHLRASATELLSHKWLAAEDDVHGDASAEQVTENDQSTLSATQPANMPDEETTVSALDMYEEDEEEGFDDLDFGEEEGEPGQEEFGSPDRNQGTFYTTHPYQESGMDSEGERNRDARSIDTSPISEMTRSTQRLSIREDPFKDLMDDPEADRERERLRKQKQMWERLKSLTKALGTREDSHVAACDALVDIFTANPEQRYYLIYDPGLLPIIEVLESGGNGSAKVVEAMLRVTISLLDDDDDASDDEFGAKGGGDQRSSMKEFTSFGYPRISDVREDLCLAGFLPVVMRYCRRSEPFRARLLSARFFEKMLELERVLHMFIACRGFSVFVEMLEPDIVKAGELARIALDGVDRLLSMENQRHKRDFCRRFAWSGLLERLVDGISHNMNYLNRLTKRWGSKDETTKVKVQNHVTRLAKLLQTFAARADSAVKLKMTTQSVLNPIIKQVTNKLTPEPAVHSILCCVRDLSRDPQTHRALQSASAIETLVQYLCVDTAPLNTTVRHLIISSLHNLCIVSPMRQEAATKAGLVPHLQRFIISKDINYASLCIDMYTGLACAGHATRVELSKHNGVDFYVDLLVSLSLPGTVRKWQARVLQSLAEWLEDAPQSGLVESKLVMEKNKSRVCGSLATMRAMDIEGVLEPYLKMITVSDRVNKVFGENPELVSAMVRWLQGMYDDSNGGGGGPRGRLLLLRTFLAHARLWTRDSEIRGLVQALKLLLTEVVLVGDEAITVREQASILLLALNPITIEM